METALSVAVLSSAKDKVAFFCTRVDCRLYGNTISLMKRAVFLWDQRPGSNVDHIRSHGMTPDLWEMVFYHAHLRLPDKDDSSVFTA